MIDEQWLVNRIISKAATQQKEAKGNVFLPVPFPSRKISVGKDLVTPSGVRIDKLIYWGSK